jgi:tRNA(Arg) A34 adenosine deaminase TadA
MKCRDEAIRLALEEASQSEHRTRHGSVLFKNGKIIQSGRNQFCGLERLKHFKNNRILSIHAEMNVIAGLPRSVTKGATIVIVRIKRDGTIANSKPCNICMSLIKSSGIKRVIWTDGPDTLFETCITKLH